MAGPPFELTDEQHAYRSWVREVARDRLLAVVQDGAGRAGQPRAGEGARARSGCWPSCSPAWPDGGAGRQAAAFDLCLLREALATVSTEAETALALQGLGTYPIVQAGTREQVERWVPAVASRRRRRGLRPERVGRRLRRRGAGAAGRAGLGRRVAAHRREALDLQRARGRRLHRLRPDHRRAPGRVASPPSSYPGDRAGLSGEHLDMVSPHPIGSLVFDGVRVEADEVLGEVDQGFAVAMRTLDLFRPSVGAFAVGMAQAAFEAARDHADSRQAFGGPLRQMQSVAHTLAEMAMRIDASRLLVYRAAAAYDAGRPGISTTSAMAKLFATETAQWVVDAAIQIHGAQALQRGHLLEHLYREVRAPRIYEGASEVQRSIIARDLYR